MNLQNKVNETQPGLWMTKRYLLALIAVALLATSAFGTVGLLISEHQSTLAVVNISGRQRMLSQRTALFVAQIAHTQNINLKKGFLQDLNQSTRLLAQSHQHLTGKTLAQETSLTLSQASIQRYFKGDPSLNSQMLTYLKELHTILALAPEKITPDHPSVKAVMTMAPNDLLKALDDMVRFYQEEGEDAFYTLQLLEASFLFLTLLILTIEALFIFRPMVQHVTRQMERIHQFNREMEETVKRRTVELEAARKAAVQANQAKSKFLAAAGHDLKQPLEAIGMFTGMLEKRIDDERNLPILRDMHDAQRSMRSLLDSILSLSKLEAGVVEPHTSTFALQPLFDQLVREYRAGAAEKGLEIRMVSTSAKLRSDPLLLERMIRNLLSNAVRYTQEGKILLGVRHKNDQIHIEVCDTGRGIPEDGLESIFTEFSQLDDPDRDRSEGIGLGLAIVKRLADLLNVEVVCQSIMTKGSKFTIILPVSR